MQLVREILDSKGRECWSVAPETSVYEAIRIMVEKEIGSVLVVAGDEIKGLVTERDYARKVGLELAPSPDIAVEQIMTTHVLCTRPDQPIDECMALMTEKRVRHLPVVVDGKIIGVVSIGDLVKAVISEQQFIIEQLENYIAG